MATAAREQKELLALIHQHLVQIGFKKAAKELLEESGQKTFPSYPVPLREIFIQWKASSRTPKQKADDINRGRPAKIRVPDPKSSSESSEEEEAANIIKTNLPVNNSSVAKAESSSEDEDSSSEEEAVTRNTVKNPVAINKTDLLQLAAQKTNSFPGKGVAVAAVQAKQQQNKATPNKVAAPAPPVAAKTGQNKVPSDKQGPALQTPVAGKQTRAQAAAARKAVNSESGSSSSESEEEEGTVSVGKIQPPKQALQKAESSSEDSSDDSDSEDEETNAATAQVKPAVQSAQVNTALAKKSPAVPVPSKGNALQVSSTKTAANQVRAASGSAVRTTAPTDSSDTSDSSDSEDEGAPSAAQTQSAGKPPQAPVALVKNTPLGVPSEKAASTPTVLKQTPKPSVTTLAKVPPPAKAVASAKKAESSESSESSSESETETPSFPLSQKVKPAVQSAQVNTALAKKSPAVPVPSKGNALQVSSTKTAANQVRAASGSAVRTTAPTDSSDTSDSSDSEDEGPPSAAQTQSAGKPPQAPVALVKNTPLGVPSEKAASTPTVLKQTPKPSVTTLAKVPPPAKAVASAKKAESSESSESSSESETETPSFPLSQKDETFKKEPPAAADSSAQRLQTPQPPTGAKPSTPVKAASASVKGKEVVSESSSSSDSEDETVPAAHKMPLPSAKANAPSQPAHATKPQHPTGPLPKAQASEDSSQDSSDESDSEEDSVFTQKPTQVTQKPAPTPVKALATKIAGAVSGKVGNAQSAGRGTVSPVKSAAASLQKASETDSSDSSASEETEKPVKVLPIHPFFKQMAAKAAVSSRKGAQTNSSASGSVSNKCQGPAPVTPGKVEQSPSKKAKLSQGRALPAKPAGISTRKEDLGSSSSSDSEEEEAEAAAALPSTKQIPQPGTAQKQGVIKEPESSSEESSDEDQEASQSFLKGLPGHLKITASAVAKSASPVPPKQRTGKTGIPVTSALAKASPSSSSSSDSSTEVEEPVKERAGISSLPLSGMTTVVAKTGKGGMTRKRGPGVGSKASAGKKATAKAESNGKAKGIASLALPLSLSSKASPAGVSSENEEAIAHTLGAGAPKDVQDTLFAAAKPPKTVKSSKGVKEKPPKKRKLAAGDAAEPKPKKLKVSSDLEKLTKKKAKKKSKSPSGTKVLKQKDGKEKKSKKKKKSKKLSSHTEDGSQKKKKKKKKTGDLKAENKIQG